MNRIMTGGLLGLLLFNLSASAQTRILTEEERGAFQEMALEKTESLSNYISTLCDKAQSTLQKVNAMELALRLFVNEESLVEISSKHKSEVRTERIPEYLNRLRILPYERVEITWYDVGYVSEMKLGTDGRYHATITIYQKFVGYGNENRVAYEDLTQKNISVVMDTQVVRIGDWVSEELVVKLGNISVVETK